METAPPSKNGPLRVLLLNRGGCDAFESGVKTLLVLQRLMYYIRPSDNFRELPRPCEIFNCIVGNGSGGILALLLGRFQLTTFECLSKYTSLFFWLRRKAPKKGTVNTTTVLAKFSGSSDNLRSEPGGAAPPMEEWGSKLLQSPRYIFEHLGDLPRDRKPSRNSRLKRSIESPREFDQISEGNLDLCFSAKSMTQASLVHWVDLTLLLNGLGLKYPTSDCLTLVSTSKDPGVNILSENDFRRGGYTPRNAETLQRLISALIDGDTAYYGPTTSLPRMTKAHPDALTFGLLKEHSLNINIELLVGMRQHLHPGGPPEPVIHSLPDGLRPPPGGSYYPVPVPALEFGSIKAYEPASSFEYHEFQLEDRYVILPNKRCFNTLVESYAWHSTLRNPVWKQIFKTLAAKLRRDPLMSRVGSTRPLRLLSLDGGGVRGLSSLLILQEQMKHLEKEYGKKDPWEIFDLIGGTSTGGLLAIMLGRLRLSIKECISEYENLGKHVFERPNQLASRNKYSAEHFGQIVRNLLIRRRGDPYLLMQDCHFFRGSEGCKVFVVSLDVENLDAPAGVKLIRSYTRDGTPDPHFHIWEAARATCAAPTIFQPAKLDSHSGDSSHMVLVDGGLGHNNPTLHLLEEARAQWPGRKIESVLSIGTGRQKGDQIFVDALISTLQGRAKSLLLGSKYLKQVATSSENIHEAVKNQFAAMGYSQGLFRYSVPKEYDMNVELDDYKKYSTIRDSTAKYLSENAVQEQMVRYSQIFGSNQSAQNPGHIDLPDEQQVHLSPEERSRIQCEIKADIAAYNPSTYPIEALEFRVGIARFSSVSDFHDDPDILNQGFGKVICTIPLRQGDSDGEAHSPRVVWQLPYRDPGNFLVSWLVKLVHEGTRLGPAEDPKKLEPLAELKNPISPETPDKERTALLAEAPETADTPTAGMPDPALGTTQKQTPPPEPISVPLEFSATGESSYQGYSEDEEATPLTQYQHIMCLNHQWEAIGGDRAEPLSLRGGGKIQFAISLEESRIPEGLALLLGGIRSVASLHNN